VQKSRIEVPKERAQNNLVSFAEANSPGDSKSPGEFARLFCARSLELVGDLGFEGKIVNFLMRQGGKMGA